MPTEQFEETTPPEKQPIEQALPAPEPPAGVLPASASPAGALPSTHPVEALPAPDAPAGSLPAPQAAAGALPPHLDRFPAQPAQMPHPTYWPFFMAMGIAFIAWGLIATWIITMGGLIVFTISLIGWINILRHE